VGDQITSVCAIARVKLYIFGSASLHRDTVSEADPFLKARRLLYHSTQGARAYLRTFIETNTEEERTHRPI
jgi:hypothetical protein